MAVRGDQMPRPQSLLVAHVREEIAALLALNGDRPEPPAAVPGHDLGRRPTAESAIRVVEDDCRLHGSKHTDSRVGAVRAAFSEASLGTFGWRGGPCAPSPAWNRSARLL